MEGRYLFEDYPAGVVTHFDKEYRIADLETCSIDDFLVDCIKMGFGPYTYPLEQPPRICNGHVVYPGGLWRHMVIDSGLYDVNAPCYIVGGVKMTGLDYIKMTLERPGRYGKA